MCAAQGKGDEGNVRRRRGEGTGRERVAGRTCASVAFWNASKIFFSATVSRVFLSTAFQTMPYACAERGGGQHDFDIRDARHGRKASDSSVAHPFPQLLLDLILPQHVLVYFFAHDSCSRARSALERRRRAARLRVGLSRFPNGSLFFARLFCENELTTVTVLAAASTRTRRSCLTRLSRHSAPAVPSRKLSSALDMNGRITDTSIALRLVNFTPLSAFSSRARNPA